MNTNQIINMVFRLFFRKLLNRGINAGLGTTKQGRKTGENLTPEERAQAKATRQMAMRARQTSKLGRRIGRM